MSPLAGPLALSTACQTARVFRGVRLRAQMTISVSPSSHFLPHLRQSKVSRFPFWTGSVFVAGGWL